MIPGVLWQSFVYPVGSASARVLRVYALDNGNAILERFWSNEVRALHRIAARGHRLLPKLVVAANVRDLSLGFLVIDDAGDPLEGVHPRLLDLRRNRLRALKAFADLSDAVAVLHGEGMVHRSISPHVVLAGRQDGSPLQLDGFQMSAFVAGLLRGSKAHADRGATPFVPAMLTSTVCLAPERLGSLLNGYARSVESFACDVFGLGMIAADWFGGPPTDEECRPVIADGRYVEDAHLQIINGVGARLRRAEVPAELRRLIEQMAAPSPSNRIPSAPEVAATLGKIYGGLVAQFEAAVEAPVPHKRIVYFLRETIQRLYEDGIAISSPQQPDEREYADLVAEDLLGGSMAWAPRGFAPWVKHDVDQAARAQIVLFGKRYAHFCQYLNKGMRDEDQRILLVKYPCPLHKAREIREASRQQPIPPVRAMFFDPGRRARPVPADAPSWKDSIEQVRVDPGGELGSPVAATASWLVGYQEGLLASEEFAYDRIGSEDRDPTLRSAQPIILRSKGLARAANTSDRAQPFLELLRREGMVRHMGEYFERAHEEAFEAGDTLEFILRDATGKDLPLKLLFDAKLDPDTVRFKLTENDFLIPNSGRIRPDDFATRISIERQRKAVRDLAERHDLLAQLRQPRGLQLELLAPLDESSVAFEQNSPEAARLVKRILEEEPLFAVQGPPGTGKTFIASHAVRSILKTDPLARILVSAQSNAATDNILDAVEEKLATTESPRSERPLLLRHSSAEAKAKLTGNAPGYTIDALVVAARKRIEEECAGTGPLPSIRKPWRKLAKDQDLDAELHMRLPRAANVVFATCIGSGAEVDALRFGSGFDWVIIEEAAHAWLSEIAVALVQGDRWLMIGDQNQLPAYGADDVERVFRRDVEDQVTTDSTGNTPTEAWRPYLSHFRHVMEVDIPSGHWTAPRAAILEQRRMAPDIGTLVSNVYYDCKLTTHPDANRPHHLQGNGLEFLSKRSLVWFDTAMCGSAAEESGYENMLELELVKFFLGRVRAFPSHDDKIPPLAILSPYKRQLQRLQREARGHSGVKDDYFRTVDSVQGRQAEVVIVSLVRNNAQSSIGKALGFLRAPERANVMFSRARRLLVIIGSLAHFSRFPGTHWGKVVEYIRSDEKRFVVDPMQRLGFVPAKRRR
ncbi:MAG TPA: AAA domain-containing protein [Polyangia bacterium]|nr:AAA domain-containing protein [Polyangia bacterium]